ncbi:PilN domain-containing protein [Thiocapsa marina]|uniref:Fimbrial assembly family protein n=1 Tax=Thiocapsa marina 5811 TaxID=768671 RepID=F9UCA1_9GAMM|nr:PilN domain-containing protein [Thiocapsa marina]EGV18014.1 Fimbrial assembly family protein [Thiocapsa marina 5811]
MSLSDRLKFLAQLPNGPAAGLDDIDRLVRRSLLVCLPISVRRFLAHRNRRLVIEPEESTARLFLLAGEEREPVGELGLDAAIPLPEVARSGKERSPTRVLMMPREDILTRSVSLPSQVRANLPQVIRFELDRLSPFQAGDVLYDFLAKPGPKGAPRLKVDLALCRRDLADAWVKRMRDAGAPIDRIAWEGAWSSANLLPPAERPKRRLDLFSVDKLLWAAMAVLIAVVLIGPLWQQKRIADALDAEVRRSRVEAVAVDDLRQELERARLGSTAVLRQKLDEPNILVLLRELSDRIPDDTWIQTLDYNSGQVELRGESGQATALIALLEQAPGIDEVSFRSPVTQVPQTGKERFNISLRFTLAGEE